MSSSITFARSIQNQANGPLIWEANLKCLFGWQCLHWSGLAELKSTISLIIHPRVGLCLKVRWILRTKVSSKLSECLSAATYRISSTKVHDSLPVHVQKPGARNIELLLGSCVN